MIIHYIIKIVLDCKIIFILLVTEQNVDASPVKSWLYKCVFYMSFC
jgi:hypothetical protein